MGEAESLAGRVLADKYLLTCRLGEGGFGSIWRAEHQVLKSPVAVKLIDLDMARKDGAVERFLREAQATAALRSPHVVQVLDYGVDGDQPFIVMELLEGENLADRIARVGPLAPVDVVRIVTHVARAMGKAHELGIVHRDLKPENIFLVSNGGDDDIAKVLDFGVAKFAATLDVNQSTYTITGSLIGTPYYMSPEQAQGNKTVDHRSDLWALGVIAFEALTGKRPFDGDALGDLVLTICVRSIAIPSAVANVPAGFDAWFARSVERDPDARFQSAREMALALVRVIEGDDAEIRYTNTDERLSQKLSNTDGEVGMDIPSRPATSAFAATVRDDALGIGIINGGSILPAALQSRAATASRADDIERAEHLTPWTVAGIAILALAAGAAAVYGVFFLVRAHDESNELVDMAASSSARSRATPALASSSKRRFDVIAPGKPYGPSEPSTSRTQRAPASSAQEPSPEPKVVPDLALGLTPAPGESVTPTVPAASSSPALEPPAPPPVLPVPAAPPENLAPPPIQPPLAVPDLSAASQPLDAPPLAPVPNMAASTSDDVRIVPNTTLTQSAVSEPH